MQIKVFEGLNSLSKVEREKLFRLHEKVLGLSSTLSSFQKAMETQLTILLMAYVDGQLVGFKMGYADSETEFYSWMGAVEPFYRNRGVAEKLMRVQHETLKQKGFRKIRTEILNGWNDILLLNLKNGYQVVGSDSRCARDLKIILQKKL